MKDKQSNQRETSVEQAGAESRAISSLTESVTDLELSSENAADVQGGAFSAFGNFHGGVNVSAGDLN